MRKILCLGGLLALSLVIGCGSGGSSGRGAATVAPSTSNTTATTTTSTTAAPTSATTGPVGTSGQLRLLSYNVAGLPGFLSGSNPTQNTPQISTKLNTYDVVLVQEDFWYHAILAGGATHAYKSVTMTGHTTLMNDGLNRYSEFPFLLHQRTGWNDRHGVISNSNDALSSKGFSVAVHELAPGVEVHVWNHHADAGSGQGDLTARARNFDQLANAILSFSAGQAVIVAGDTNLKDSRPSDVTVLNDFLGRVGLTDAARALGKGEYIDRVMVRSSANLTLTPVLWRHADEFRDASGNDLSDHPALNVDIDWVHIP
jgi:endonuclease/exonuclease/phosphatase family metal-dependent hydrolase